MSFEKRLQRNLGDYLARDTRVRPRLTEVISEIKLALPDTVIFGGMLREFALGNSRNFVSDIDMVTRASMTDISVAVSKYNAIRNKFGGFRFIVGKQRFDIWSLNDTWAFKNGVFPGREFYDLLGTSFFNLDAGCYHISENQLICLPEYGKWIQGRILDINLLANPNPKGMARRALTLIQTRQLYATHRMAEYITSHIETENFTQNDQTWLEKLREFLVGDRRTNFRFAPQIELAY